MNEGDIVKESSEESASEFDWRSRRVTMFKGWWLGTVMRVILYFYKLYAQIYAIIG